MSSGLHTDTYKSGFLENADHIQLFYQAWIPETVQAAVVIVHGVGEHSGRYEEFAHFLTSHHCAVYTFDLRGYGRSGGQRGFINAFTDFTADVTLFVTYVKKQIDPSLKLFLLGHSLGAIIVVRTVHLCEKLPLDGMIISGPPFKLNLSIPAWWGRLCIFFSSLLPALTIKERSIQLNMLTHDKEKIEAFRRDPYRHYQRSLTFIREYFKAEKAAFSDSTSLTISLLIVQGGEDDIIDVQKVKDFYHQVPAEDKMLIIYPEMYHEVLNEVDRSRVFSDIYQWISKRITRPISS